MTEKHDAAPTLTERPGDDRQAAILDAAFHAFATYGFRRVAMEDIARGAGMSRSALYLHYRNKEDIFRSLAQRYFETAVVEVRAALYRPGQTTEQALMAAFIAKDGKFMEAVLGTPHGAELMDAGFAITSDLAQEGEARLKAVLVEWLAARGLPEGLGRAEDVAQCLLVALKGLKSGTGGLAAYRQGEAMLAKVFARALA
jgi:AcrR family transcriptional regulator